MTVRPLASLDDINTHLSTVANFGIPDPDTDSVADPLQLDAFNVIMSRLSGVFSQSVLDTWVDADSTPGIIRSIASRLIAAKWYMRQVNGDSDKDIPPYSMQLYNEAMSMLADVINGSLAVLDDNGQPIATGDTDSMTLNDFWPNASTPGPYFTMAAPYAQ